MANDLQRFDEIFAKVKNDPTKQNIITAPAARPETTLEKQFGTLADRTFGPNTLEGAFGRLAKNTFKQPPQPAVDTNAAHWSETKNRLAGMRSPDEQAVYDKARAGATGTPLPAAQPATTPTQPAGESVSDTIDRIYKVVPQDDSGERMDRLFRDKNFKPLDNAPKGGARVVLPDGRVIVQGAASTVDGMTTAETGTRSASGDLASQLSVVGGASDQTRFSLGRIAMKARARQGKPKVGDVAELELDVSEDLGSEGNKEKGTFTRTTTGYKREDGLEIDDSSIKSVRPAGETAATTKPSVAESMKIRKDYRARIAAAKDVPEKQRLRKEMEAALRGELTPGQQSLQDVLGSTGLPEGADQYEAQLRKNNVSAFRIFDAAKAEREAAGSNPSTAVVKNFERELADLHSILAPQVEQLQTEQSQEQAMRTQQLETQKSLEVARKAKVKLDAEKFAETKLKTKISQAMSEKRLALSKRKHIDMLALQNKRLSAQTNRLNEAKIEADANKEDKVKAAKVVALATEQSAVLKNDILDLVDAIDRKLDSKKIVTEKLGDAAAMVEYLTGEDGKAKSGQYDNKRSNADVYKQAIGEQKRLQSQLDGIDFELNGGVDEKGNEADGLLAQKRKLAVQKAKTDAMIKAPLATIEQIAADKEVKKIEGQNAQTTEGPRKSWTPTEERSWASAWKTANPQGTKKQFEAEQKRLFPLANKAK